MTIERILVFIRNVLQVPPNDNDKRGDNDATVHDEVQIDCNNKLKQIININSLYFFATLYLNIVLSNNKEFLFVDIVCTSRVRYSGHTVVYYQ